MKKISITLFLTLFIGSITFSQICPQTGNLIIPTSGQSSSTLNSVYTGGVIVINGHLNVDDALTFDNCTIYIADDIGITVEDNPNAKLKIVDCDLFSCGSEMWRGILVKAQGSLDMQGSTLEDAVRRVHARNSSGLVTLLDNTFNKNHIHILAETANAANISIYGNDFFCHEMGNTFSTNGDFLEAPFLNQQTEIAIEGLSTTNTLTIGNPNFDVNNFFECKFGIKLVNCNAVIKNNHFENIGTSYGAPQNQPYPYETPFTAVLAFDFFGVYSMEIGGGGINEQNTVNRCIHGFEVNDYRIVNINFNHFTNDIPNPGNFQTGPGNTAISVNIVDHAGNTNINITNKESGILISELYIISEIKRISIMM